MVVKRDFDTSSDDEPEEDKPEPTPQDQEEQRREFDTSSDDEQKEAQEEGGASGHVFSVSALRDTLAAAAESGGVVACSGGWQLAAEQAAELDARYASLLVGVAFPPKAKQKGSKKR